ncbi:hypothetical protein GGI07_004542 [Coemansia sp. Benny D115]|nr:hypothetical protein GGI07_004542 [Coemansia sp. Benny D115]
MDTAWCTFCGTHIDCAEDALYCSAACQLSDGASQPAKSSPLLSAHSSAEYFSLASPTASPVASSPTWLPQSFSRERSSSLTPVTALDLSARLPCHAPAYSPSRSPVLSNFYQSPALGPSALDARGRGASLPSSLHQLSTMS